MSLRALVQVLHRLPSPDAVDEVLLGLDTPDDAGVYLLDDERALVQTVDYFTPVVDDPVEFGRVAAANALSDVYAMGAAPLTALNLAGFPENDLPLSVLHGILQGSSEILQQAGVHLLGGHTIDDSEPKFGLAVTGIVHPERMVRISGAVAGDVLVLTKPLGVGVMTTGIKRGLVSDGGIRRVVEIMTALNREASEVMVAVGVHAATDVTGFGLLGHAAQMADASGCSLEIFDGRVPVLDEAVALAKEDIFPGGTRSNLEYLEETKRVSFAKDVPPYRRLLLADAITSGGLLIACPKQRSDELMTRMKGAGVEPALIGRAFERLHGDPSIRVLP